MPGISLGIPLGKRLGKSLGADLAPSGGGSSPPASQIPAGALLAISCALRLTGSYGGPAIRVRRSSDNAETDIGFVNNALDTAALLGFVGAGSGFVTTAYDQSGAGRHLTQADTALQPIVVSAGALVTTAGGIPTMTMTADRGLSRADALGLSGAPALTMGIRYTAIHTAIPVYCLIGGSNLAIGQGGFAILGNNAGNFVYASIYQHGPDFFVTNPTTSHYYVARIGAGAANSTAVLRQDGANCSVESVAGNGALPINMPNQITRMGGPGYVGATGANHGNVLCLYNENMTGQRLTDLETVLALHL